MASCAAGNDPELHSKVFSTEKTQSQVEKRVDLFTWSFYKKNFLFRIEGVRKLRNLKTLLCQMRDTLNNLKKDKEKWQLQINNLETSMNQLIAKIRVRNLLDSDF